MANPYESSNSQALEKPTFGLKSWNRRQWITAIAGVLVALVLSLLSLVLILQALRLNAESANLPSRLQADYLLTARSSWIGGCATLLCALLTAGSLVFVTKNKLAVPMAFVAIASVGMIAIAFLFKPV